VKAYPTLLNEASVRAVACGVQTAIVRERRGQWADLQMRQMRGELCLCWVKETFAQHDGTVYYKAVSAPFYPAGLQWKAPMFMPKAASRLTLQVLLAEQKTKDLVISFRVHKENIDEWLNLRRIYAYRTQ
jgi:hypothetical protein